MKKLITIVAVMLAMPASAGELVRQFSGSRDTTTAIFTVESPWLLDWRVDGDYDTMVAIDVTLVEARTGRYVGRVLHTKRRGNGLKLFNESGSYQLKISTTLARWTIKIEQLTPDEAEAYAPRNP